MGQFFSFRVIRITSFGVLICLNVLIGYFFHNQLTKLNHKISIPIEQERPILTDTLKVQNLVSKLDILLHRQLTGQITDNEPALELLQTILGKISHLQAHQTIQSAELVRTKQLEKHLKQLRVGLIYYKKTKLYDSASSSTEELFEIIDETLTSVNNELSAIISVTRQRINDSDLNVLHGIERIQRILLILFTIVVAGSLLILFIFNVSLSRNLNNLIRGTSRLGEGDLDWRIRSRFNDEFGKLGKAFDSMAQKLSKSNKQILQQTEKIEKLAYYDSLTELPNRVTFLTRLKQEIERASRGDEKLAVLFIDLDDFKLVNDSYGHDVGDSLLQQVAERIEEHTRLSDTVARLAGDEFTVLLTQQKFSQDSSLLGQRILDELNRPFSLSHRIIEELSRPFKIEEKDVFISSSIGIAVYPDNGLTAEDILKSADTAMYAAKEEGKNNFKYCSQEMAAQMDKLLQTEKDLRKALLNEEFELFYQPQINLENNKLCGFEALIRWNHPEKGFISPDNFIPIAEERGLIRDISKWVLETVCRQQKAWGNSGLTIVPIMVNLSTRDFYHQDIAQFIFDLLEQNKLSPALLGVEITETSVMEDKDNTIDILERLKEKGIKVALDDFGTGYSSLNYLKILPIDVVKIDRTFLYNITSDPQNAKITETIIKLSHSLGFKVLAEGVETDEQCELIKKIQCNFVQGYLFSKPLPTADVTELLNNQN